MNISLKGLAGSAFSPAGMLKSTKDKLQRREDMENQVAALKDRQAGLKNRECDTLESIAEKLELYHSYESEIAGLKKEYNMKEAMHVMDEAEERGKKIAEAAEKRAPKTEEERRKEALEEATGTESGLLAKLLEENPIPEEELADDFEFQENWAKIRERIRKLQPEDLAYSYIQKLSDVSASLRDEYRAGGGEGSFADSVTMMAKAYQTIWDRIDEEFDNPDREVTYYMDENGELVEETREHCKEELARTYDRYTAFVAASKRIMTEIRQKFHGEFEGVDPNEVEEATKKAYQEAVSEENLGRLREKKESVADYSLSFSVGQDWLTLLSRINRIQ